MVWSRLCDCAMGEWCDWLTCAARPVAGSFRAASCCPSPVGEPLVPLMRGGRVANTRGWERCDRRHGWRAIHRRCTDGRGKSVLDGRRLRSAADGAGWCESHWACGRHGGTGAGSVRSGSEGWRARVICLAHTDACHRPNMGNDAFNVGKSYFKMSVLHVLAHGRLVPCTGGVGRGRSWRRFWSFQ